MTPPCGAGGNTNDAARPTASPQETWELRLYVTGRSPKCLQAIENLRLVCEQYLQGRYHIDVVDLLDNPHLAAYDQILAVPTLVRRLPPPIRKVVGDLSDTDRLLAGLELPPRKSDVP